MSEPLEIEYKTYLENRIPKKEIIDFLLSLDKERETLFYPKILEEDYPQICEETVDKIYHIVIASHNKKIIGLSGVFKKRHGIIGRISPFFHGLLVVTVAYQGKRIGSKLSKIENDYIKTKWGFRHNMNLIENIRVIKINERIGVIKVGIDEGLLHSFRPTRSELKILNPLAFIILRLLYIEYPKLKRRIKQKSFL